MGWNVNVKKVYYKNLLVFMLVIVMVLLTWQGLELIIYGEVQPRKVDTIMGSVLSISIFMNIKFI
jgi:hypothetical protein